MTLPLRRVPVALNLNFGARAPATAPVTAQVRPITVQPCPRTAPAVRPPSPLPASEIMPPTPDLDALVARYGGYNRIPPAAWAEYDMQQATVMVWLSQRHVHKKTPMRRKKKARFDAQKQ